MPNPKKPRRGPRRRKRPLTEKVGDVEVPVYTESYCKIVRGRRRRYQRFTVAHYRLDGEKRKRFRQSFASLQDARFEANRIATAIANSEAEVLKLKGVALAAYLHAQSALAPLGTPLTVCVDEYVAAKQHAAGVSLIDAVKEYSQRHAGAPVRKTVAEVVTDFIGKKQADGMSVRYLRSLRSHLNRFAKHFQMPIGAVTASLIEDWLAATKRGPRTRKNLRNSVVTLFRFAKRKRYLPRTLVTEAEHVGRPPGRGGKPRVLRPEQLAGLLELAGSPEKGSEEAQLYFALAGFSGLRRCELVRLDWQDIEFLRAKIDVGRDKAKTASRRRPPILPNLAEWLAPFRGRTGRVFKGGEHAVDRIVAFAKASGVLDTDSDGNAIWPRNALRDSYASYRLEQIKNAPQVALEMGNSPQVIFKNYLELVDERDAEKWFAIVPPAAAPNVVQMKRRQ